MPTTSVDCATIDGRYYEVVTSRSLSERLLVRARDRIYDDFNRLCRPHPDETILDVGVSDVIEHSANVLERRYPYQKQLTAVGLGTAEEFQAAFPKIKYQQIVAGQPLPFEDSHFDIVTSNAVLEHVGSQDNQRRFVAELLRVSRRVFLTVPHRFFPVEHHTAFPFLHWTDTTFSLACHISGKQKWSCSENLILMTRNRLLDACPSDVAAWAGSTGLRLGPFSSNLYLYAERQSTN